MCSFWPGFVVSPEHHGAIYPPLWHVPLLNNIWTQPHCWSHSFTVGIFHSHLCFICLSLWIYKEFKQKDGLSMKSMRVLCNAMKHTQSSSLRYSTTFDWTIYQIKKLYFFLKALTKNWYESPYLHKKHESKWMWIDLPLISLQYLQDMSFLSYLLLLQSTIDFLLFLCFFPFIEIQ